MRNKFLVTRFNYLFTFQGLANVIRNFLIILGVIWLLIEAVSFLFSDFGEKLKELGVIYGISVFSISIFSAIIKSYPRTKILKTYKASNTSICIKVGNILDERCHIVVGDDNYFEMSSKENPINSVKNQIIKNFYASNYDLFYEELMASLSRQSLNGKIDDQKTNGKNIVYPIGTTAILKQNNRYIYAIANSFLKYTSDTIYAEVTYETIFESLRCLWIKIKNEGRSEEFSIPVLGTGYSRSNLSHLLMMQAIITSYALYSKTNRISERINIVIHPKNYDASEMEDIENFLNSIII